MNTVTNYTYTGMDQIGTDSYQDYDIDASYGEQGLFPSCSETVGTTFENLSTGFPDLDVEKFMMAADQEVFPKPVPPTRQSNLYADLISEEFDEFQEAFEYSNDTEQLDACVDLIWVILGYMHSRGWSFDGAWGEVARTNLSKIDPETGRCIKREDGKILKPEGWKEPNFQQYV